MKTTKNPLQTLWELIQHILNHHPELAPHVEEFALKIQKKESAKRIEGLLRLTNDDASRLLSCLKNSKSQILQDIFVLSHLGFKTNGYFVEFGATNGVDLSNTYQLEKNFGWQGILAEPAACWHENLKDNRSCNIETRCVWKNTGSVLSFNETDLPELATIKQYSDSDFNKGARTKGKVYDVDTISLADLLIKYQAPKDIDYLSIDTEGSEYEILSSFDFSKYRFEVITCEHNFTPMRGKIHSLLTAQGYRRVFEDLSQFDDWYVQSTRPPIQ